MDSTLVGRSFDPVGPYLVSAEKVREFATAIGWEYDGVPPTFPIVLAGASMNAFLDDLGLDLSRIVHGEQRFSYRRSVVLGDELTSTLTVASLRQIGGNDIIGTSTAFTDATGETVCTATATLVHRSAA